MSAQPRFSTHERTRHGCADLTTDPEDWVAIVCDCGTTLGVFPDNITAVDALIDHVIERSLV